MTISDETNFSDPPDWECLECGSTSCRPGDCANFPPRTRAKEFSPERLAAIEKAERLQRLLDFATDRLTDLAASSEELAAATELVEKLESARTAERRGPRKRGG